jgi:hypothetical protein
MVSYSIGHPSVSQPPSPETTVISVVSNATLSARDLPPEKRQALAVLAMSGTFSITALAQEYHVSRKFVYQQVECAGQALADAFAEHDSTDDKNVLFQLPVTKNWIKQLILALILNCHASFRGCQEVLRDLLSMSVSLGSIHNLVQDAADMAERINGQYHLANVGISALDELFQSGSPVLVGADVDSSFCFLLSLESHRDAETWGVRLLELAQRGFNPQAHIADFGTGLRAGCREAIAQIPCRGDIFHALNEFTPLVTYLENRAYDAIRQRSELERKRKTTPPQLAEALAKETQAIRLAEDMALLYDWLRRDVLAVAGPDYASRCQLYDFLVAELQSREPLCEHRIKPVRRLLANHRAELLAFAQQLEVDLQGLAEKFEMPVASVRACFNVQLLPQTHPQRWVGETDLFAELGTRYYPLRAAVVALADRVVRSSSVIENLNSRLRNYFFLRRQVGTKYLALLQFFLNHHRFPRSERSERVGKSPAELFTGRAHTHWLEMLGYRLFQRVS